MDMLTVWVLPTDIRFTA